MNRTEFETLLAKSCTENGILPPNSTQTALFLQFTQLLLKVNQTTNLTAIREPADVISKHYVDSLSASARIPNGARVLDLGCGPGFPSIPLAITRPDLKIFALDSTDKKIKFVSEAAKELALSNLTAYTGRAEAKETRTHLGRFDVVVSRAVSRMNVLCELCLPYLKVGGTLIALKGAKAAEELTEAQKAIAILGGTAKILPFTLKIGELNEQRAFIEVTKIKETPPQYPRQYAAILKKPLS